MAVLLAIAAASYRSVASLAETGQWIGHTHEVLAAIDAVVAVTTTAETSARGYALTGEERFLETYQADARGAEAALATLRRMTADNPGQQRRGDGLEPLVREHLARLADTVAIRRDQSGAAAAERVRAGSSTGLAESIQVAVGEMRAAERTLLAARVGASGARAARTRWIILSGSLAVVMVTVVSSLLISREIERRRAIDRGLRASEARYRLLVDRNLAAIARIEELNATLARQNRELAAANQELDALSYSISHDLRAPLRAMQGFSDALLEDYRERLDATGHDYAKRIVAASRQMDALIQDLLAYSRLVRAEISLDPLSLETVVDEACGGLEMELKECEGEIAIERPLGRVLAHRAVLGQIVSNLLANAIKFTRPDTPPRVRVRSERAGGRVRLWVEDDGIGIAPEHRERIFRAFERLHGVQQYPGTGIGLAIVQKGATRLGGQAGVESEPGAGSRFWVDLAEAAA